MTNAQTREVLSMDVSLNTALGFHLSSRLFPAPHPDFYPGIRQAIEEVALGNPGEEIEFPNGRIMTASHAVEQLRLWDFVQAVQDGGEFE